MRMLDGRGSRQLRRRILIYAFCFLLIVGFAALSVSEMDVAAQSSEITPNGTIPGLFPEPLRARVTFLHAAPFATPVGATAIDICDQEDQVIGDMTGIVFQQVELLVIDPGAYRWKAAMSGSSCVDLVLELPELRLAPGSQTLVVITGDRADYPIDSIVTTLNPGGGFWHLPIIIVDPE
ncbi:MAG: hypothetical protein BroJett021_28380 [Chloroflexota bacterium]|nr:MAG: hypothetical protein BroJett021_28380 [Chloroflexota bacterium]